MANYLFQSERLGFRSWRDDDISPMTALNLDERVMEFFPALQDEAQSQTFIDSQKRCLDTEGFCFFAVDRLDRKEFIGFIGLMPIRFEADFTPGVEIGWRLSFDHWGLGYATEGAIANLSFAFNELKLDRVLSFTAVRNKRSESVMQKIGMSKIGEFNHPKVPAGHALQRHVLYEIQAP